MSLGTCFVQKRWVSLALSQKFSGDLNFPEALWILNISIKYLSGFYSVIRIFAFWGYAPDQVAAGGGGWLINRRGGAVGRERKDPFVDGMIHLEGDLHKCILELTEACWWLAQFQE